MTRVGAIEASARRYLVGWSDISGPATYMSGLRPVTPDGLPVIGPLPELDNAWIASGHAMLGLTLGPATAEIVADGIVSGEVMPVIKPFLADRFIRRAGVGTRERRAPTTPSPPRRIPPSGNSDRNAN